MVEQITCNGMIENRRFHVGTFYCGERQNAIVLILFSEFLRKWLLATVSASFADVRKLRRKHFAALTTGRHAMLDAGLKRL